jgi:hypothetical protein
VYYETLKNNSKTKQFKFTMFACADDISKLKRIALQICLLETNMAGRGRGRGRGLLVSGKPVAPGGANEVEDQVTIAFYELY